MNRKIQISILLFLLVSAGSAQQLFNYSQNLLVPGLQNPSFARYNDEMSFNLVRKSAFATFEGAPVDNNFYFSAPINDKNGIGVALNQNQQGIFKEVNANLQYARAFSVTDFLQLGMGVSAGVKNQSINFDQVIAFDVNDPFLISRQEQNTTYDASFGMYLSTSKFLFRVAIPQLIGNRIDANYQKLNQHVLASVQHKFIVKNNFILIPSVGYDYIVNAPSSYNAALLLYYKKLFWIGAQYKSEYSISPLVGVSFKNISLSYSYDYSQMNYTNLGLGHEILLQYTVYRNVNTGGNISSKRAEEDIVELIDEYFDVQNSEIDLFEKAVLMRKIQREIDELMPYLDKEKKKVLKKKFKTKNQKTTPTNTLQKETD